MPPRILAIEFAVVGLHVLALLDARLSIGDGYIFQTQIMASEQGSLTSKFLVFNQFHCLAMFCSTANLHKILQTSKHSPIFPYNKCNFSVLFSIFFKKIWIYKN
jgi:hypothetical protein